jgi:hypothetical protein
MPERIENLMHVVSLSERVAGLLLGIGPIRGIVTVYRRRSISRVAASEARKIRGEWRDAERRTSLG